MIKHGFAQEPEAYMLFNNVEKFSQFKNSLKKLGISLPKSNPVRWGRNLNQQDNQNKILGDGFELFCELLVMHMGFHPHIGLANYEPVDDNADNGVDAYANNIIGERVAIQCKFKSNLLFEISSSDSNIMKFPNEATLNKINWCDQNPKKLFLFTTCKGLNYHTDLITMRKNIHVFNYTMLSQLTDNNKIFWKSCSEIVKNEQNNR